MHIFCCHCKLKVCIFASYSTATEFSFVMFWGTHNWCFLSLMSEGVKDNGKDMWWMPPVFYPKVCAKTWNGPKILFALSFGSLVFPEFQLWTHPLPCNLCLIPKTRSMTTICLATTRSPHTYLRKGNLNVNCMSHISIRCIVSTVQKLKSRSLTGIRRMIIKQKFWTSSHLTS